MTGITWLFIIQYYPKTWCLKLPKCIEWLGGHHFWDADLIFQSLAFTEKICQKWIFDIKRNARLNCFFHFFKILISFSNFLRLVDHILGSRIHHKHFFNTISLYKRSLAQKGILTTKNHGSQKIGPKTFGQNQISNSWDIAYLYKCRQDICCLDNCRRDGWHPLKLV